VTVTEKLTLPPTRAVAGSGDTETVITGVAVTWTTATAFLVESATLVAITWKVPVVVGAVYRPEASIAPPAAPSCTDQVTVVDCPGAAPVTVAVKLSPPPGVVDALAGMIATTMFGTAVTSTVATSVWNGSATLATTTWKVPVSAGARYAPVSSTVPPPASWTDQVTAVDWPVVVPETDAANFTAPPEVVVALFGVIAIRIGDGVTTIAAVALRLGSAESVATT
jgi:hypothetical protein